MVGSESGGRRDEPTLELPSLFGRRRRGSATPTADPTSARALEPVAEPADASVPIGPVESVEPAPEPVRAPEPDLYTEPSEFRLPRMPGALAAVLTGLLVGGIGAGLTALSLRGCESLTGTDSCGGPGLAVFVAILFVMVLFGGVVLKAWRVSEPGATSFVAVAMVCVVALVALTDVLFSQSMFVVIPVLSAASYALARWVTNSLATPEVD